MIFDAYLHVGLPRFQSIDDAVALMDHSGVDHALVCAFDTGPDLHTVHRAIMRYPDRFIAAGLPLGRDRGEVLRGIDGQFTGGFAGLRLSGTDAVDRPWILDRLSAHRGFALVCGEDGLAAAAGALLRFLDSDPAVLVIAGHFAGTTQVRTLDDPTVSELFAHDRFVVNFSRQGATEEHLVVPWAQAVLARIGWERVLWASEAPVLYWRNETLSDAMAWIDRLAPNPAQRRAFFSGNAERVILSRPRTPVAPLSLPFDPISLTRRKPAQFWPTGVELSDRIPARLIGGWRRWGGPARGRLDEYVNDLLDGALR